MKKFKSALALLLALIMTVSCGVAAFATDLTETDNNNTAETATDFELADTVSGRLEIADDVDYFTFEAASAGIALVTFGHEVVDSTATYFTVKVLDENLATETEFTVIGKDEVTYSTQFSVDKGVHYIVVSEGQVLNTTLGYNFSVKVDTEARAEKEPNNTAAAATTMELSTSGNAKRYLGNLSQDDVDYFVVNVPSNGFIYLYIYNSNGKKGEYKVTASTYVEGEGGVAVLADLGSIDIESYVDKVMSEPIGVTSGKYYIKIEGSIGGYETRVFFSESTVDYETEYNNDFQNPDAFTIGKTVTGSLYDENDADVYKFTVTKNNKENKLVVTPDASAATTAKWTVSVYDAEGTLVTTVDASSAAAAEIALNDFEAGVYYVRISTTKSYHNAARYTISTKEYKPDDSSNKSFLDKIKSIDWSKFLNSFKGWFGKIDYVNITKSIVASIKTVFGMLDL